MKKLLFPACLLLSYSLAFAQKDLPKFGDIDEADLQMKECEFDKDAQAYKLLDYGEVRYSVGGDDFNIQTDRRTRIKILKEKGLDEANIKINFYSVSN